MTLVLLGLSSHAMYRGSGDEPHYLAIAHSLAFDFDLDLSNNYGTAEPLIDDGSLAPENHVRPGAGGVVRPVHDVGMPLLFAPFVRVVAPAAGSIAARVPTLMRRVRLTPSGLYRHCLGAAMTLLAAALACLLFDAMLKTGAPRRTAFWTAMLVALSPPLLIHSVLFFTEILSALLCLSAFRAIALERDLDAKRWALAGAAVGYLPLVHARNVGLVAGLALVALVRLLRHGSRRDRVAFAAPMAVLLAARTALNHHLWGTFVTNPHSAMGAWTGWSELLRTAGTRLLGLLVDQEFGLLPYAPVFLVAFAGIVAMWRSDRTLWWKLAAVAGAYLLAVLLPLTNVHGWTGGWSPAARFMVPIVPLLALGLVGGMRALPRALVAPIVAMQLGLNLYFWQHPKNLWNDGNGRAAICERGGIPVCDYLPSVPR